MRIIALKIYREHSNKKIFFGKILGNIFTAVFQQFFEEKILTEVIQKFWDYREDFPLSEGTSTGMIGMNLLLNLEKYYFRQYFY